MLAFYDLCAVLTPCGPLKALVNLMQEDDSPDMPGLLYEAQLPGGVQRPGGNVVSESDADYSPPSATATATTTKASASAITNNNNDTMHNNRQKYTKPPPTPITSNTTSPISGKHNSEYLSIPLAIAKVYKLKLVSPSVAGCASGSTVHVSNTSSFCNTTNSNSKSPSRRKIRQRIKNNNNNLKDNSISHDEDGVLNPSPLLTNYERSISSNDFYDRKFSVRELTSDVEVEMPRGGGRIIKRADAGIDDPNDLKEGESCYVVMGRDEVVKRVLVVNQRGKVYELEEEEDDDDDDGGDEDEEGSVGELPASIRLGLVRLIWT